MFDSDSDNDMEFEGFQEDWPQNNFASRLPSRFKLIGGATVQHPEEAEAHHYNVSKEKQKQKNLTGVFNELFLHKVE
jgi:hypothetical protein